MIEFALSLNIVVFIACIVFMANGIIKEKLSDYAFGVLSSVFSLCILLYIVNNFKIF